MKIRRRLVLTILGLGAVSIGFAQEPSGEHVPGRLLVQHAATANDAIVQQVLGRVGARVHQKIEQIRVSVLEVPEPALDAVTRALQSTGLFTFVERDHLAHGGATIPNDPDYASQWHLSKIQAANAWGITLGSTSMPIAIIDSGVDPTHPDLVAKLLPGWNFLNGNSDTHDVLGHGTAVAGTAAASTNNLTGVAGVGWSNPILPLVVLSSSDSASYSHIASAINYAADHGARIISISIGGSSASSTLQNAVNYAWSKGAVVFASAMNNSSSTPYYPAACTNAVAVSSTESNDAFSSFSNHGNWITLSAPGNYILTTNNGGGYGSWAGTSFSAPIAASVGALALAANPGLTPAGLVALLKQNSDDLGAPGYDAYFGWGRVNAYKAALAAKNGTAPSDTTPPTVSITSPVSGATVSGTILVSGTATDNKGVTNIQFYVDGVLAASSTASPFSFSWNSALAANSSHTLTVKAYDAANNVGSAAVAVIASNDKTVPIVSINSPLSGSTVSGTVTISGTASDNVGVTQVQWLVDGAAAGSGTTAVFSFSWNTAAVTSGSHTITVKAYDQTGNVGSAAIQVTVAASSTQGPVGYWKFDENLGSIAYDTSGNGYKGTIAGATWVAGKIQAALSFNGSTSYVVTPNIPLAKVFSVSAWVNPAVAGRAYVRIAETRYNGGLYLGTNATGTKYKFIVNTGLGTTGSCGASYGCAEGGAVASGWHLVTATFDGTTAKLYVDNAVVASDTFTAPPNTNYPLYVGRYYGGNGYNWNGVLDEIRLYNRALTGAEVTAIYNYTGP